MQCWKLQTKSFFNSQLVKLEQSGNPPSPSFYCVKATQDVNCQLPPPPLSPIAQQNKNEDLTFKSSIFGHQLPWR